MKISLRIYCKKDENYEKIVNTMSFKQVLKKYFYFISKSKKAYIAAMVLMFLQAVFSRIVPYLYGQIIDSLNNKVFDIAVLIVAILILARIANDAVAILKEWLGDRILIRNIHKNSQLEYMQALQRVDYEYHTNKSSGSLISLAKRGDNALFIAYFEINDKAIMIILEFILSIIILATLNVNMAVILAVIISLALSAAYFLIKLNVKRRKEANRLDDIVAGLRVDNLIGFETVKLFAQEDWEMKRMEKAYKPLIKAQSAYVWTFRYIDITLSTLSIIAFIMIFAYGIHSIQNDLLSVGAFTTAMVFVFDISRRLFDVIYKLREIAKVYTDLTRYFQIMDLKSNIKESPNTQDLTEVRGFINFKDVNFSYNQNEEVLSNINIEIKPDETVALVGKSGSGKTTLTKLLMRFYDVDQGQISIDHVNIKNLKIKHLRKAIGLVPQDPVLFNQTIAFNISYGNPDTSNDQIINSAKKASLHEFIMSLPNGYQTIVGERGIKLSGGQKQRLAIARIILTNPEIIIFDEATSQLDSENEKKIQEAFHNLTKNKTTIIIAHRLSTVMSADKIIVFENGQIVQRGTHEELATQPGVYQGLWELQTSSQ
jgi:ATP-binding cassette subfamily B protein